jgi:LPS-assembly protein
MRSGCRSPMLTYLSTAGVRQQRGRGLAFAMVATVALMAVMFASAPEAQAQPVPPASQDNAIWNSTNNPAARGKSSFAPQKGGILGGPVQKIDKAQPLYLQADELDYDTRNNRVIARGNVEIYYNNYVLTADQVIYDQSSNSLTAQGNAQIKEPNGNIVRGDKIDTTADFRDAFIQSLSFVGKDDSRIAARRAVRKDGNVTEFEQGKFTPCKSDPGKPPLWCISAQRIVHDQQAATITYQDAQFEVLGQPLFYLPYFSHADPSVKRRSGFLAPEYKTSSTLGFGVSIPYYFALSPNYDFTFQPEYLSKQGVLLQGEWRQKVAVGDVKGEYSIKLAGIDQDASTLPNDVNAAKRESLDGWRGSLQTKGVFSLSSWWKFGWDITAESDETFRRFYKLDNILQTDRVNTVFVEGLSNRNYFSTKLYQFGGLLLDEPPTTASWVMPVIDYNYIWDKPVLGGELSFAANAVNLTRNDGTDLLRASVEASWRRKMIDGIGQTWTPFANVRADVSRFTNGYDPSGAPIPEEVIARAIGAVGVTYAYPFVAHTATGSHVLEPTAQIIARPSNVNQRQLPDEDAKSLVWDDTLLFDTNKFSGWDRIETGTRANVGLQYTFQANNGGYARFIAGQSLHLAGENPYANPGVTPDWTTPSGTVANFSPTSGLETNRSDYVLGTSLAPVNYFRVVAQGRFDETELSLRRTDLFTHIDMGPLGLNAQYSYRRDDPAIGLTESEQEVIGQATLRLTDRWSLIGTARFDIDQKLMLQDVMQVKYADECFVLTASYIETRIDNPTLDIRPDRTLMLRFELKYLGDFSYKTNVADYVYSPHGVAP